MVVLKTDLKLDKRDIQDRVYACQSLSQQQPFIIQTQVSPENRNSMKFNIHRSLLLSWWPLLGALISQTIPHMNFAVI